MDELLFAPLLITLPPNLLLAAACMASLLGSLTLRRALEKAIFNAGQMLVTTGVALFVCESLSQSNHDRLTTAVIFGSILGTTMIPLLSKTGVLLMIAFATRSSVTSAVRPTFGQLLAWVGMGVVGATAASLSLTFPWGILPSILLVVLVQRAFSAQLHESAARVQAERLQQATAKVRSTSSRAAIEDLLFRAARELLGAKSVFLTSGPLNPTPSTIAAPMSGGALIVAQERLGPGHWTAEEREALVTLAGVADDALRSADLIAQLQTITDAQTEGVVAFDVKGLITFANPAA
ncbi:MAG: hypothetical protein ACRDP1_15175, partial [Nocardioidaceae bacterium]